MPKLRLLAKEIGRNHHLAIQLWDSKIHEARLVATLIDDPSRVTEEQMEAWASDFNSWDLVDGTCCNLFDQTKFAYKKAVAWIRREEEFIKRAGFVLMACLAVHDKAASDERFRRFLLLIEKNATDDRNFVKKGANWALRQIGKRNWKLWRAAVASAERIAELDSKAARWIAADALRELRSEKVMAKLG